MSGDSAPGKQNIVPLRTLLRAAGIAQGNLDTFGDFEQDGMVESARYAGLVLQVRAQPALGCPAVPSALRKLYYYNIYKEGVRIATN
jgi:hypothetical protein